MPCVIVGMFFTICSRFIKANSFDLAQLSHRAFIPYPPEFYKKNNILIDLSLEILIDLSLEILIDLSLEPDSSGSSPRIVARG